VGVDSVFSCMIVAGLCLKCARRRIGFLGIGALTLGTLSIIRGLGSSRRVSGHVAYEIKKDAAFRYGPYGGGRIV
jgi:hypothetical protein